MLRLAKDLSQEQRELITENVRVFKAGDLFKEHLELVELLLGSSWGLGVLDDVESDSLGERSALANSHNIAELDVPEAGREVDSHVLNKR